jgi:hypothetical protein
LNLFKPFKTFNYFAQCKSLQMLSFKRSRTEASSTCLDCLNVEILEEINGCALLRAMKELHVAAYSPVKQQAIFFKKAIESN